MVYVLRSMYHAVHTSEELAEVVASLTDEATKIEIDFHGWDSDGKPERWLVMAWKGSRTGLRPAVKTTPGTG